MQTGNGGVDRAERAEVLDMEQRILERFLAKPRKHPARPAWSHFSILIIRKEVVPFYYAIYDHELGRFVELQYRAGPSSPLRSIAVPGNVDPGTPQKQEAT